MLSFWDLNASIWPGLWLLNMTSKTNLHLLWQLSLHAKNVGFKKVSLESVKGVKKSLDAWVHSENNQGNWCDKLVLRGSQATTDKATRGHLESGVWTSKVSMKMNLKSREGTPPSCYILGTPGLCCESLAKWLSGKPLIWGTMPLCRLLSWSQENKSFYWASWCWSSRLQGKGTLQSSNSCDKLWQRKG